MIKHFRSAHVFFCSSLMLTVTIIYPQKVAYWAKIRKFDAVAVKHLSD